MELQKIDRIHEDNVEVPEAIAQDISSATSPLHFYIIGLVYFLYQPLVMF